MTFQIHALDETPFQPLFTLSDADLAARNMLRVRADTAPGYPCRISLQDAEIGENLILLNYQHLKGRTPYCASHAIYIRQNATRAHLPPDRVPDMLARRLLSVRGFNAQRLMVDADVVDGTDLASALTALFSDAAIDFVHIHNARQGCFAAAATRG